MRSAWISAPTDEPHQFDAVTIAKANLIEAALLDDFIVSLHDDGPGIQAQSGYEGIEGAALVDAPLFSIHDNAHDAMLLGSLSAV
jgi:hypothetical protein